MRNLETSELASMYMEATTQLSGLEDATYLSTLMGSTGDEQHFSRTTPNSMCQYWDGGMTYPPHSSSTRYQWRELYVAWRLAIHSPNLPKRSDCPLKAMPFTRLMGLPSFLQKWSTNSLSTANMMCFCVKKYSNGSQRGIRHRSYDS